MLLSLEHFVSLDASLDFDIHARGYLLLYILIVRELSTPISHKPLISVL